MSRKTHIVIVELIQHLLQIIQSQIKNVPASVFDKNHLLLWELNKVDNYSETPEEIDKLIGFIQLACDEIKRDPRLQILRDELAADPRIRKLSNPNGTTIPGAKICLGSEVIRSILWRYLNTIKNLSWNQAILENILQESEQTLDRGYLRVDMVLPLLGLSGAYSIPRIDLGEGWFLREMNPEEHQIFNTHIHSMLKLPCTMIYPGNVPPKILRYALVKEFLHIPFSELTPPGNVIHPRSLPYSEIDFYLSVLQIATAQAEPGPNFCISSPVIMYRSMDWAINTFGNPFNVNFSWPLHSDINSFGYYRDWFAAPGNWNEWVTRCLFFINNKKEDEKRKIFFALRWYAESVRSNSLEDRFIKLMVAAEALFGTKEVKRGKGERLGEEMAKWCHNDPREKREWKKFIQKIYKHLRDDLIHEGSIAKILNEKIQSNKDIADLENTLFCADLFETCFLLAWNGMVVNESECSNL